MRGCSSPRTRYAYVDGCCKTRSLHCSVTQGFKGAMEGLSNAALVLTRRPKFGEEADESSSDEDEEVKYGLKPADQGPDAESVSGDSVSSAERRKAFRLSHVIIKGHGPVKLPLGVALEVTFDKDHFFSKANRDARERAARYAHIVRVVASGECDWSPGSAKPG